jgi:hypothetical protein
MNGTCYLSLRADMRGIVVPYCSLVARLAANGRISQVWTSDAPGSLSKAAHDVGAFLSNPGALADQVSTSGRQLVLATTLQLPSGTELETKVKLNGMGFLRGMQWLEDANLQIEIPIRSLIESGATGSKSAGLQIEPSKDRTSLTESKLDWLFLLACGMTEDLSVSEAFDHGAMHYDERWPSPIECAMFFHRQSDQWMRDYKRMAIEFMNLTLSKAYYCGTSMHVLQLLDDVLDNDDTLGQRLVNLMPPYNLYYRCYIDNTLRTDGFRRGLRPFLERLTREDRASTDADSVRALLDTFEKVCNNDLRYRMYKHAGRGTALVTTPRLQIGEGGYLWDLYARVEKELWNTDH